MQFERVISGNWHLSNFIFLFMSCFASGLSERGIFPVYCTSYFCVKCVFFFQGLKNGVWSIPRLKNEVSFKSFALEMGCLIVQDFKNEAYIPYTVLHIFVLSAFFFFKAWKTTLHGFKNIILPILSENYVSHGNLLMRIGNVRQKKSTSPVCFF